MYKCPLQYFNKFTQTLYKTKFLLCVRCVHILYFVTMYLSLNSIFFFLPVFWIAYAPGINNYFNVRYFFPIYILTKIHLMQSHFQVLNSFDCTHFLRYNITICLESNDFYFQRCFFALENIYQVLLLLCYYFMTLYHILYMCMCVCILYTV